MSSRRLAVENLRNFLRISEAAEYLGVSPNTLRNWENAGKIAAHRHPVNDYRLFKQDELDALLSNLQKPRKTSKKKAK
jgi:MerR family copper efflux transcriptional regulator